MRDSLELGSSPVDEDCAQVGTEGYYERAKTEIKALRNQLIRIVGEPPRGATLKMKGFPHDFGTYHELGVVYDDDDDKATEYAFRCESECPQLWDDLALKELEEAGYPRV